MRDLSEPATPGEGEELEVASGREGDKARCLPRMDRAPGTGPTPFTDPPLANLMGPRRGRRGVDPTSRLWGHRRPRDAVPTSHPVPGVSMHVRAAAPQPRSREPWCLGFPTERAGLGAAPCAPASPQSILPTLLPPPGRPPHPLPTRPRLPMASPDTSHKRRSVVLPGPLNSARLCVLGKGCAGGGARWAPVVPRTAQGRAGGWGLGEQAGAAARGPPVPGLWPMAAWPPCSGAP